MKWSVRGYLAIQKGNGFKAPKEKPDVLLVDDKGSFNIYWFDTPVKHRSISVEYRNHSIPGLWVALQTNTASKKMIKRTKYFFGWHEVTPIVDADLAVDEVPGDAGYKVSDFAPPS